MSHETCRVTPRNSPLPTDCSAGQPPGPVFFFSHYVVRISHKVKFEKLAKSCSRLKIQQNLTISWIFNRNVPKNILNFEGKSIDNRRGKQKFRACGAYRLLTASRAPNKRFSQKFSLRPKVKKKHCVKGLGARGAQRQRARRQRRAASKG